MRVQIKEMASDAIAYYATSIAIKEMTMVGDTGLEPVTSCM